MLIWLKEAPVFGVDDDSVVTDFIDQIITCQWPVDNPELEKTSEQANSQAFSHLQEEIKE